MSEIKNIVFDMGNVLILYDYKQILTRHGITDESEQLLVKNTLFDSEPWREYDRGTVEKDSFIPVIDSLPEHLAALCRKIVLEQCFALNEMPPFPVMFDIVKRLKENGYKIYLLSNAGKDFAVYSKNIPALTLFDGKFVSSDYLLLKPEDAIYRKFFEVFGLNPNECIFIDDVKANTEGAIKNGMDAICFNSSLEPHEVLIEKLRKKGIKI